MTRLATRSRFASRPTADGPVVTTGGTGYSATTPADAYKLRQPDYVCRGSSSRYGIQFCHSRSNGATQVSDPSSSSYSLLDDIIKTSGHTVLGTDQINGTHWGNDAAIVACGEGATFLQTKDQVKQGKVHVFGQSMGTILACNWARANRAAVASVVLILPIPDLTAMHSGNRGGWTVDINTAYGGTYVAGTHAATHSPAAYAATDLAGIPVQLWAASDDPYGTAAEVAAFVAAIGASADFHNLGALGHTATAVHAIDSSAVTAFLGAHT